MSIKLYDKSGETPQEVLLAGTSTTDLILNGTSKNPIANKTVYNALATKIESTVENLVNFYNKSQVYNKQEVRDLIGAINTLTIEVVNELPTQDISATTIYFLKQSGANTYDEYIYVDNAWVKIGDTDIDLSGYLTTANFQIAIADYYTKSAIDAMIANYYTKTQVDAMVDAKQDELTFDNAPTVGSDNPVKSGGIKTALDAKQNTLTFDSTPTASSSNPVTSDGIKDAIDDTATDIYKVMGKNGAKNLLKYPYPNSTGTTGGVSFVDNGDGSIAVNGTASSAVGFRLALYTSNELEAGRYILSVPQVNNTINIAVNVFSDGTSERTIDQCGKTKASFEFDLDYSDYDYVKILIWVPEGTTVDNIIIKPMLRLASDTDSTYQPYAMTNQQITPYVQAISNPNLLDNPWFTVNQRRASSYTANNAYCVDRWKTAGASTDKEVKVVSNGLELKQNSSTSGTWSAIQQFIAHDDLIIGETYTISILYADGTIRSKVSSPLAEATSYTRFANTTMYQDVVVNFDYQGNGGVFLLDIETKNSTVVDTVIRAVKLEKGTVSTLANDTVPNYQQELAKCQRYFVRYRVNPCFNGYIYNSNIARFAIYQNMRISTPTVTYTVNGTYPQLMYNGTIQSLTSSNTFRVNNGGGDNTILLEIDGFTNLAANHACSLKLNTGNLDFSADL